MMSGSRQLLRLTDILRFGSTAAASLAVMRRWLNQGDIRLWVFYVELFLHMGTQCFLFVVTHNLSPLILYCVYQNDTKLSMKNNVQMHAIMSEKLTTGL
jgi:hypothetical protein